MKVRHRFNKIVIAVPVCILAVYAGMHTHIDPAGKVKYELSEMLMEESQQIYLPGFAYTQGSRGSSFRDWVTTAAMNMMPLGTYVEGKSNIHTDVEDKETYEMILAQQANDENAVDENGKLIQNDEKAQNEEAVQTSGTKIDTSIEKLKNFEYLVGNFYVIDGGTMTSADELNAEKLMAKDMKIDEKSDGPKVLIYHTHSQEAFADSTDGDTSTTIMGMGDYLSSLLNDKYGIQTMHHEGVYDLVDGKLDRSKAYQLAEPEVQKILEENPSIEVVIDLHRDGVAEGTHLVTEVNGKPTAQIMFFNGLSRTKANGNIDYLKNPYIEDNLAFSLQMQVSAANKYPGFTRRIYLRGYRYNMHLKPKTLLIEAGAQTNTVEEMRNAMEVLADTLDNVLTK